MENAVCIDTDILVNFLRNKPEALKWIADNQDNNLATTLINVFELYYGAYRSADPEKSKVGLNQLIAQLNILNLSEKSVEEAAKEITELEKKGQAIDIKDLLIGTIALTEGYSMKTDNINHFSRISGLQLAP